MARDLWLTFIQSHASIAVVRDVVRDVAAAVDVDEVDAAVDSATTVTATLASSTTRAGISNQALATNNHYSEHEKQAAHGWGAETGTAEWADEKAGEAIANAEAKNDSGFTPDTGAGDPAFTNGPGGAGEAVGEDAAAEPEDNTKSYEQYLAEQAEKRAAMSSTLSVRKPNEGSKQTFPEGKAFSRESEDFIAAAAGKARKAKEAQDKKERLTLDGQYYQAADSGDRGGRGGRGGARGDRGGRGGDRGGRGGRGGRGRGEARGGARGDARPERGNARGAFNATDASAFPALGGS